jgi:hypothetical protein
MISYILLVIVLIAMSLMISFMARRKHETVVQNVQVDSRDTYDVVILPMSFSLFILR